jgi:putative PEP-CTERM system TPR-repeat lipoprotein
MKHNFVLGVFCCLVVLACSQQKSAEEHISKGKQFSQQESWQSAVIEFKNAVKVAPENSQARAFLGKSYIEIYNYPAAIKELKRAMDLGYERSQLILPLAKSYLAINDYKSILDEIDVSDSQSLGVQARLYAIRGLAYLSSENFDKAYESLKIARSIDEHAAEVRLAWGRFEQQRGNFGAQKDWIKPLLNDDEENADAWSQLGGIELNDKNFGEAEKAYTKAIESRGFPNPDLARRALIRIELKQFDKAQQDIDLLKSIGLAGPLVMHADGVIAFQQGRVEEAKTKFQEILASTPNYLPARYMLGLIYFSEKNYKSAESHLTFYTDKNPGNEAATLLHANSLLQLQQPGSAIKLVDASVNAGIEDARFYEVKGKALIQLGELEQAIETLKEGLAIEPKSPTIHFYLGVAFGQNPETVATGELYFAKARQLSPDFYQADLALYLLYLRQKKFIQARRLAESMTPEDSSKLNSKNLVGLSYVAQGDLDRAILEFEHILQANSDDVGAVQNLARIYIKTGRLEEAEKLLTSAVEKHPGNLQMLNQLALISSRQGNSSQMLDWLTKAMNQNPDQLSPKLSLALQHLRANDASSAIQVLNGVDSANKDDPMYVLLMSQSKLVVKEHVHAIRLLKGLVTRRPDLAPAHFLMALAYSSDQDAERMRESLEKTVELVPDHIYANLYLARMRLMERKHDQFNKLVDHLVSIDKKHPDTKLLLAKKLRLKGDYKGAIRILTELQTQTDHPEVSIDLAEAQYRSDQRQAAIATLEDARKTHPDDARVSFLLAQYHMENSGYTKARAIYQQLETVIPDNIVLLNNLAWLLRDTDTEAGIGYAERAHKLDRNNPLIMDTLAMLYLENGQVENALRLSSKAADAMPSNVEIQVNHARALIAHGDSLQAKRRLVDLKSSVKTPDERRLIDQVLKKI